MPSIQSSTGVTVNLFLAVALTSEVRVALSQSVEWKQMQAGIGGGHPFLSVERHQDKEYLGFSMDADQVDIPSLREHERRLRHALVELCPILNAEALPLTVFSLVLIC